MSGSSGSTGFTTSGRIGVMGGTFDPIHIAHLIVAEEARIRLGLDRVVFVPAKMPWRKTRTITPADDRMEMVRLATASNPHFLASSVDLDRDGPSYSLDTIRDLAREHGEGAGLYFIVGMDALADLPHWREPRLLASLCRIVVMGRPGYRLDWTPIEAAIPGAREAIAILEAPQMEISSTEIRRRVATGESIRYWVPEPVVAYIRERGLYQP